MAVVITYSVDTLQAEAQGNGFTGGDQSGSDVVGAADGGYVVAYHNPDGTGGEDFPIFSGRNAAFAQRYGVGIAYGPGGVDMVGNPEMVRLANGNIAIVWDEGAGGADDVVGAIFNPITGSVIHSEFVVSAFSSDTDAEVGALKNGNWVVVMSTTSGDSLYMQLMSATGVRLGGQIPIVGSTNFDDPVVAGLADGGFAIAFVDTDGSDRVFVQTFDADGTKRSVNPILIGSVGINGAPAIAAMPNGNFAVVYDDTGYGEPGLSLHVVSPAGVNISGPIRVDTAGATDERNVDVAVLPDGSILVTWEHFFSSTDHDIYARLFTASGATPTGLTTPFIITASGDNDTNPSIAHIRQGVFVTSWTDAATDGSGGRITTEVNEIRRSLVSDGDSDLMAGSGLREAFDGNSGFDTVSYAASLDSVVVSLLTGVGLGGDAEGDTYAEVENLVGSIYADQLTGDGQTNTLMGGNGVDVLLGGLGTDTLQGGAGTDTLDGEGGVDSADYREKTLGVALTLNGATNATAFVGGVAEDTVRNIEQIYGGSGADTFAGDAAKNFINGFAGNDVLRGGAGNDNLIGSIGIDTADYRDKVAAVSVTLNLGVSVAVSIGGVVEDQIQSIEVIYGGSAGDTVTGDASGNLLRGGGGVDRFNGGGGIDAIDFRDKTAAVVLALAGATTATATVGGVAEDQVRNVEVIYGGTGADFFLGDGLANQLYGGAGNDTLRGLGGRDLLDGGAGLDVFIYNSLAESTVALAGRDTIQNFAVGQDDIRLTLIDANTTLAGNQAFVLGPLAAGQAGRLAVTAAGANTWLVAGDVDGNGVADFAITVLSPVAPTATDFQL